MRVLLKYWEYLLIVTAWQSPTTGRPVVIQRAACLSLSGPAGPQEMRRPARSHVSAAQEALRCHLETHTKNKINYWLVSNVKNGPSTNQVTANSTEQSGVFLFCFCNSVASKIFQTHVNLSSNDMLYIMLCKVLSNLNRLVGLKTVFSDPFTSSQERK